MNGEKLRIKPMLRKKLINARLPKFGLALAGYPTALVASLALCPGTGAAQGFVSPNGFSGLGLIPSAATLTPGTATAAQDKTLPGAVNNTGSNYQVGIGLMPGLEVLGRLATNDTKCNMFKAGACPPDTIRDFSGSIKWAPQVDWLKSMDIDTAIGISDAGGAANYFRSYYAVASKPITSLLDVRLGYARGTGFRTQLDGPMAAVDLKLPWNSLLSVQHVNGTSTAHLGVAIPTPIPSVTGLVTMNRRLSDQPTTERSWVGAALNFSIDGVKGFRRGGASNEPTREVKAATPQDLASLLERNGFFQPRLGRTADGTQVIEVENTAYSWNIVDAAGVALGAVASAFGDTPQKFELILTTRGLRQVLIKGDTACLRAWLQRRAECPLQTYSYHQFGAAQAASSPVRWNRDAAGWWSRFRPELVIGPLVASTIGTERGAFDFDLGVNSNLLVPLWSGAVLDINRQDPTNAQTRQFDEGGAFYASRIKPAVTRRMLHQYMMLEPLNTSVRVSAGTAYTSFDGAQIETATQSDDGRHRGGLMLGRFENSNLTTNNSRSYSLYNYRYAWNNAHTTTSEVVAGEFWGGDKGYQLSQRFWHGDTAVTLYLRQSKMPNMNAVSFAGLQISLPLTPRRNTGFQHAGVRGTYQFSYSLETKILAKDNRLTGGYGEVPRMGESLVQVFNRDRATGQYLQSQLWRMREAFTSLYVD